MPILKLYLAMRMEDNEMFGAEKFLYKLFFVTIFLGVFLNSRMYLEPSDAVCCYIDDYTYTQLQETTVQQCPNADPEPECGTCCKMDLWFGIAESYCENFGCFNQEWPCRSTCDQQPQVQYFPACGGGNMITTQWFEYRPYDCEVSNCFCPCSTYPARDEYREEGCPEL